MSLVLPYLVWSGIGFGILAVLNSFKAVPVRLDYQNINCWLNALGITAPPTGLYVLWFVREIIIFMVFAPLVAYAIGCIGVVVPIVMVIVGVLYSNMILHFAYVAIGAYIGFGGFPWVMNQQASQKAWISLGLSWVALCFVIMLCNLFAVGVNVRWIRIVTLFMNVVGMLFVWKLYDSVKHGVALRYVDKVSRASFVVYAMHTIVSQFVQWPMQRIGLPEISPFVYCSLSYLLMVCVPILVWVGLQKFAPAWLKFALSGGR